MRLGSLLAALLALAPAERARAGDVVGEVLFKGTPPTLAPLKVNKDDKVCGATVEDQTVVVENGHLQNVVITVKGTGAAAPAPTAAKVELDQKLCHYVPHVQAVAVGSTLEIVNSDPMLHNIHGRVGTATAFNLAMPVKGMRVPRVLAKPDLIHVQCDVHNFMNGWVVVTDAPFAVVDQTGRFAIKGLPAGNYTVTAWHEKYGEKTAQVTVPASGEAKADFSYSG